MILAFKHCLEAEGINSAYIPCQSFYSCVSHPPASPLPANCVIITAPFNVVGSDNVECVLHSSYYLLCHASCPFQSYAFIIRC